MKHNKRDGAKTRTIYLGRAAAILPRLAGKGRLFGNLSEDSTTTSTRYGQWPRRRQERENRAAQAEGREPGENSGPAASATCVTPSLSRPWRTARPAFTTCRATSGTPVPRPPRNMRASWTGRWPAAPCSRCGAVRVIADREPVGSGARRGAPQKGRGPTCAAETVMSAAFQRSIRALQVVDLREGTEGMGFEPTKGVIPL